MRKLFLISSIIAILFLGALFVASASVFWPFFFLIAPLLLLGFYDYWFGRSTIVRNFPIVGRMRYVMEELRPKIRQYFVESDTDGTPINRVDRELVYHRSKGKLDTIPFGTQELVYAEGYEWINHSITPNSFHDMDHHPKVMIGNDACKNPYNASVLNVSAMSFGSLSSNAIEALNGGASIGSFAHNTGEGGISPYHTKFEGDLIYQIGTGYFGARTADGNFDPLKFQEQMKRPSVKMAELKLSQGAKPGHGGILPGKKNTEEIAKIRGVEPGTDVLSPPYHKAFNTPKGLLETLQDMRDHAEGKPVGFKLCIGSWSEFMAICKAMVETGIKPDFIAVDGGEGGTGAAPPEFSDSVGTPYRDGLAFVDDMLHGFGLRKDIKIIAAGKIITGFHMFRAFALGADVCYSARAMMLALGCIQALECNTNTCPTGVATQKPGLVDGLVVEDKKHKVANYHKETVEGFVELLAAAGLSHPDEIDRDHVQRRIFMNTVKSYCEIYPEVQTGALLQESTVPAKYLTDWLRADADSFKPKKMR